MSAPNWICARVENQLRPLRAAGVFQRNYVHAATRDESGKFFDLRHWRVRWLERADPGVALDIEADVAGCDGMSGRKCGAADDVLHVLGDELFIANSVLHGADGAVLVERPGDLRHGTLGVDGFRGNDTVVAAWKFAGIAGRVEFGSEVGGAGETEAVLADGVDVIFPDVVGPDLDFAFLGEVRGEEASDRAATDDADFHQTRALANWFSVGLGFILIPLRFLSAC